MEGTKRQLKLKDLQNQVLEPVSYYLKPFTDDTYQGMDMHRHQYFEIMYTYTGNYILQIFDPIQSRINEYTIGPGQIVLLDGFVFHRVAMNPGMQAFVYNIEFNPCESSEYDPFGVNKLIKINYASLFKDTHLEQFAQSKDGYVILNDTQLAGSALQELVLLLTDGINSIEDAFSAKLAELKLFTELSKCLNSTTSGSIPYIRKANAYIQANYRQNLTIDEITRSVGLSKAYLQRQYKKYTGKTLLEQVNALRANAAAEMLIRSDLAINKIAAHVGFHNKNQFNYEFKKIYDTTPSEYRRNNVATVDHHLLFHDSFAIPFSDIET